MKTRDQITKWAKSKGLKIVIAPAASWSGSLNAAMSWQQGDRVKAAKMWAYSYYDEAFGAWVEPRRAFSSLKALSADIAENI